MDRWAVEDAKPEIGDNPREVFSLNPRAGGKHATNHAIVLGEESGGWEEDRVMVHGKGKDVEGEKDSALPKGQC